MKDNRRRLYDVLNQDYDMGSYEKFCNDIQDESKRKRLYEATSEEYDYGDYDNFLDKLGFGSPKAPDGGNDISLDGSTQGTARPEPMPKRDIAGEMRRHLAGPVDPAFATEETVINGKKVTRAVTEPEYDREHPVRKTGHEVYVDHNTGKQYDPFRLDAETQDEVIGQIGRGQRAAYKEEPYDNVRPAVRPQDSLEPYLAGRNKEQVKDLSSRIEDSMNRLMSENVSKYHKGGANRAAMLGATDPLTSLYSQARGNSVDTTIALADLQAAQRSMRNAQRIIDEANHNAQSGTLGKWIESSFAGGVQRGFGQKLFDVDTWDMGVSDMLDNTALGKALEAFDSGRQLTEEQQLLLDAKATELATNAYFGSYVGRGYKAGQVTAQSIPFMLEMCVNPLSATGKTATGVLTRYALKRFGKAALEKGAGKMAIKGAQVAARVAGDAAGATGMALTTGMGHVAADAMDRMNGNIETDIDGDGFTMFSGHEDGESPVNAFAKAVASQAIENHSEMIGDYFSPVLGAAGRAASKGLNKVGLGKVTKFIDDVKASDLARMVNDFEEHAHWNGLIGEYAEEVAGGIENAIIVGDQTLDRNPDTGVFNLDQNIDTFLGVSLMGGALSAIKTAGYRTPKYRARQAMNDAESFAKTEFGDKKWTDIRQALDGSQDTEAMARNLSEIIALEPDAQKRAALLEYVKASQSYKGAESVDDKRHMEDPSSPQTDVETSYDNGYSLDNARDMNDAKNMLGYQMQRLRETFGTNDIELEDLMLEQEMGTLTEERRKTAMDYLNAKATYMGMIDAIRDDMDSRVRAAENAVDANTNADTQSIMPATMKDGRNVYVLAGRVVMTQDGTMVDKEKSEESIVVKDPVTGHMEFTSPTSVLRIDGEADPVAEKTAAAEQIRQSVASEAASKIDGTLPFKPGDNYKIIDSNGQQADVEIVQPEDGSPLEDGNGGINATVNGVPAGYVDKNSIQQGSESESLARLQEYEQGNAVKEVEEQVNGNETTDSLEDGATVQPEAASSGHPVYEQDDIVTLRTPDGQVVRGEITSPLDDNGQYMVTTGSRINGALSQPFTTEQLDGMAMSVERDGKTLWTSEEQGASNDTQDVPMASTKLDDNTGSRHLTADEAEALLERMEANAAVAPELELTPENWISEFGEDGKVQTPIGEVKMGENQLAKLFFKQREPYFGMIKPTLTAPDVIIEKSAPSNGAERDTKLLFIKSFVKPNGGRVVHFESITVKKDGFEVSISSHEAEAKSISKEMQNGKILHLSNTLSFNSERYLTETPEPEGPDLVPTSDNDISAGKYSENSGNTNIGQEFSSSHKQEAAALSQIPVNELGEPQFGQAPVGTTWNALMEMNEGNADEARDTAAQMRDAARKELDRITAQKLPKGTDVIRIQRKKAERKSQVDRLSRSVSYWNSVIDYEADMKRSAAEEARRQARARLAEARKIQQRKGRYAKEDAALGDYISFQDYVLRNIATGSVKFIWKDGGANGTMKGLGSHLGFKDSEKERNKRIWMLQNDGGMRPDEAAEAMLSGYSEAMGFGDVDRTGMTSMDALDEILDVVRSYDSPRAMFDAAKELHRQMDPAAYMQEEEYTDSQGNPTDENGDLIADTIDDIEDLRDEDFTSPWRNVELPRIPANIDNAIGANGKPIIIKKNIFEKNRAAHEFSPEESRHILGSALYNADLVGQVQPKIRENNWVVIKLDDKSPITVLEVSRRKKNIEIVGWYILDRRNLERIKRQAEREGGELLILTPDRGAAASLSTLPHSPSLGGKVTENSGNTRIILENQFDKKDQISQQREVVNTNPTEAQKEAGNYRMGHVRVDGLDISIENPKGSVRKGVDSSGKEWQSEMHNDYGYIRMTEGVDGDHIDVFLSDTPESGNVYVIDQIDPESGRFDEHKVMYGFPSESAAREAYLSNYEDGWKGLGNITEVTREDFGKWIASSRRKTKPFAEYSIAKEGNAMPSGEMVDTTHGGLEGIKPVGHGEFGDIYDQFKGKPQAAVKFLLAKQSGEATDVLHHKDISGGISLVWGNSKAGLSKIARKHPEALDNLQGILDGMRIVQETDNRIKLESNTHFAVISKEFMGKPRSKWLLTAYEKKNSALDNTMDTGKTHKGNGNDTATPESTVVSSGKDSVNNPDLQVNGGKTSSERKVRDDGVSGEAVKPHLMPGRLAEAYASGSKEDIERAENNIRTYIEDSGDNRALFATYHRSKDNARQCKDGDVKRKVYEFIASVCKDVIKDRGINPGVLYNKGARERLASETKDAVTLDVLSADGSPAVVGAVIRNPHTADGTLERIKDAYHTNGLDRDAGQELMKRRERESGVHSSERREDESLIDYAKRLSDAELSEKSERASGRKKEERSDVQKSMGPDSASRNPGEAQKKLGEAIVGMMRDAGIEVIMDEAEMRKAISGNVSAPAGTQLMKTSDGEIYGFTKGGKVYLDPRLLNANTPIHEYTHLWDTALQKTAPDLWKRGKELMMQLPLWNEVKNDPNYSDIADNEDMLASEVHSRLSGAEGERLLDDMARGKENDGIFDKAQKITLAYRIKRWLDETLAWVRDAFSGKWNRADLKGLTVEEFSKMPIKDLAKGFNPTKVGTNEGVQKNSSVDGSLTEEERAIVEHAKAEGTYMKAPNGKPTRLSERQWVQVRTRAFKNWFGDWEKTARIEKLRKSIPLEITGEEIEPSTDLKQYKKNALEYGKELRGEYVNKDTGVKVVLSSGNKNGGLKEVLQHDINDARHLQSVAAIPAIIENSVYIDSVENEDVSKNANVAKYHYYVCGLKIGGEDYTVRAVIAEQPNGDRYYDHKLTSIEKGKLLDELALSTASSGLSSMGEQGDVAQSHPANGSQEANISPASTHKDRRLVSILQTNSSKVVDENGEPLVVYHGSRIGGFSIFDNKAGDDGNGTGAPYGTNFFSDSKDMAYTYSGNSEAPEYGTARPAMYAAFLNIREPLTDDFGGAYYNGEGEDIKWKRLYNLKNHNEQILKEDGSEFWKEDELEKFFEAKGLGTDIYDEPGGYYVEQVYDLGRTTNTLAREAMDSSKDGVIIKYVWDLGGFEPERVKSSGTVYVTFASNQIKSATDNAGSFGKENSDIRYRKEDRPSEDGLSLVAVHNISEEKLRKALRQGGLANPSAAVVDLEKGGHSGYGEISLVLPSSMVDKRTGQNAGTFEGDAWTPTYPQVERRMSDKGAERCAKDVASVPEGMQGAVRMAMNNWLDGRESRDLGYLYLHERGEAPQPEAIPARYSDKTRKAAGDISNGAYTLHNLDAERKQEALDLYIENKFDGDKAAYEKAFNEKKDRTRHLAQTAPRALSRKRMQEKLELMEEQGFDYEAVADFFRDIEDDVSDAGQVNVGRTLLDTFDIIKEKGLEKDFARWRDGLNDRYGVNEVIFDGFTPSGKRRYVENTLANVSRLMKKEGRQGATGLSTGFNNFAASLMKPQNTLAGIRRSKGKLTTSHEEVDAFRDKWGNVFYDLGMKLQPGATGFEYYGLSRLSEAAKQKDPRKYIKDEYGIDFSDEDTRKLKEMVDAIRNEYPAMYFETKFERPVMLDEFAAAVVPDDISQDIRQALENAGLELVEYKAGDEDSRRESLSAVSEGHAGIRFRLGDGINSIEDVNTEFNDRLAGLTEENADRVTLSLGRPSVVLLAAGVENKPMKLYGSKVIKKMKKHGFTLDELRNLPQATADPIAVFNNYESDGRRSILTELKTSNGNFLVTLNTGKGTDIDFNIVSSVFGKGEDNIVDWFERELATYIDKEKALDYLHHSALLAEALSRPRLNSATKIVENFENPNVGDVKSDGGLPYRSEADRTGEAGYMEHTAKGLAESLGVKPRFIHDISEIEGADEREIRSKRDSKGWYDPRTGEIVIVLPNAESVGDVESTVLHEIVGHKGLQAVVGRENFNDFLDKVYESAVPETRARIVQLARKNNWNFRLGTEEYIAGLAEDGFDESGEQGLLNRIRQLFSHMLSRAKIRLGYRINDNDLRYMLWRSWQMQKKQGILGMAEDIAMQQRLGVGEFRDTGIRYRKKVSGPEPPSSTLAQNIYNSKERIVNGNGEKRDTANLMHRLRESYADSMLSLKSLMDAISEETGKHIEDHENAYVAENAMSSKNRAQTDMYIQKFFKPVMDIAGRLSQDVEGYENLKRYLIAKHGLERNIAFSQRDAEADAADAAAKYRKEGKDLSTWAGVRHGCKWNGEKWEWNGKVLKDYSGLTALTESKDNFTELAEDMVKEYEGNHKKEDITELWEAINAATKETLKTEYESGLADRKTYHKIRDMFAYYVPLRGWNTEVADSEFDYLLSGRPLLSPAIKTAKGRKSLADDPIATIMNMAESAISMGNRNLMKQRLLNLALNHPTGLLTVSEQWYVKDTATGNGRPVIL